MPVLTNVSGGGSIDTQRWKSILQALSLTIDFQIRVEIGKLWGAMAPYRKGESVDKSLFVTYHLKISKLINGNGLTHPDLNTR